MSNDVFANGREVSCKKADGKAICAFPDVCFTPPENPATPPGVPIPYPNTGMASDATEGSKDVKISGEEVMLKNKSYFKKSSGDEAGCAAKKGVVTSTNRGKVYFNAWSMDVKFEGENVVRHLDLTTHNHMSFPGNSPTWPYLDSMAFSGSGPCKDVAAEVDNQCSKHAAPHTKKMGKKTLLPERKRKPAIEAMCKDPKCRKALRCVLSPKSPSNCCPQPQPSPPKQTPHHIVPDSQFKNGGGGRLDLKSKGTYDYGKAPCICAKGVSHSTGVHGKIHTATNNLTVNHPSVREDVTGKTISDTARWKVSEAESVGAKAVAEKTKCDEACVKSQTRRGHKKMGIEGTDDIRPTTAGEVTEPPVNTTKRFKRS
jgi:hypothetical protein